MASPIGEFGALQAATGSASPVRPSARRDASNCGPIARTFRVDLQLHFHVHLTTSSLSLFLSSVFLPPFNIEGNKMSTPRGTAKSAPSTQSTKKNQPSILGFFQKK